MSDEPLENDRGIVSTYDTFKGFGFIRRKKGKDVFFFYDEIADKDRDLNIGDLVEFSIKKAPKGPRAYEIKKIIIS